MPDPYEGKRTTAEAALARLQSGRHVLLGSGAAVPQRLVAALDERAKSLADIEVLHLLTLGQAPYLQPEYEGKVRHNALFVGPNTRGAVERGLADYTPCSLSELPALIRSGRLPVDVALVETTPPESGFCSLGVSVDIVKAAVETAELVVAQANPRMPWTHGDSRVLVEDIDAFVVSDLPIPELAQADLTADALWIGRYAAQLVEDGSTLQVGIGSVPDAVLASLAGKKDLGIHSEMISDGVLSLLARGAVTGRRKTLHPGKIVASLCMGSAGLYKAVDRDPRFEFHPVDYVNAPEVIAKNERLVAINSALFVDLTGQTAADSLGATPFGGVGGQADFARGAARSEGGKFILALPSTAKRGTVSRVVACLPEATGVTVPRAEADFVVTEYGIASLKGKSIRERAVALIQVAHPSFREGLKADAKRLGLLDAGHVFPSESGPYLVELEARRSFGGLDVLFRPLKPSDERRLKDLFYSQSMHTTTMRFGIPLKRLSEEQFQRLVAIDFDCAMAIGAFAREGGRERLIGVGRYCRVPGSRLAEGTVTVHDRFQGKGLGTFLLDYLVWVARQRGFKGFHTEVLELDPRMRRILKERFERVRERDIGPDGTAVSVLFDDWKGGGNPAETAVPLHEPKAGG